MADAERLAVILKLQDRLAVMEDRLFRLKDWVDFQGRQSPHGHDWRGDDCPKRHDTNAECTCGYDDAIAE
jgi:hypothetical protein